jgi:3-(3-hydroxy-phenyl)propionate hydroxylase
VLQGHKPPDVFACYDQRRRPINIEYVQQQTVANKNRLEEKDPVKREANFEFLRKTAADPQAHRAFLLRTSLIASLRKQEVPTSAPAVDRDHGAAGDAVFT